MSANEAYSGGLKIITRAVEEIDHLKTGELARKEREAAGVTLREMARRLELSAPYISDLELGRRLWTYPRADSWNEALKA